MRLIKKFNLELIARQIDELKIGLDAEIVKQEEVFEEFPVCCNSGHTDGYIDGVMEKVVYQPRIAFPDNEKRETSRKKLEELYSFCEYFTGRRMAGKALGYSFRKFLKNELCNFYRDNVNLNTIDRAVCFGTGISIGVGATLMIDSAIANNSQDIMPRILSGFFGLTLIPMIVTRMMYGFRDFLFRKKIPIQQYFGDVSKAGFLKDYRNFVVLHIDKRNGNIAGFHYDDGPEEYLCKDNSIGGSCGGIVDISEYAVAEKSGRFIRLIKFEYGREDNR